MMGYDFVKSCVGVWDVKRKGMKKNYLSIARQHAEDLLDHFWPTFICS